MTAKSSWNKGRLVLIVCNNPEIKPKESKTSKLLMISLSSRDIAAKSS